MSFRGGQLIVGASTGTSGHNLDITLGDVRFRNYNGSLGGRDDSSTAPHTVPYTFLYPCATSSTGSHQTGSMLQAPFAAARVENTVMGDTVSLGENLQQLALKPVITALDKVMTADLAYTPSDNHATIFMKDNVADGNPITYSLNPAPADGDTENFKSIEFGDGNIITGNRKEIDGLPTYGLAGQYDNVTIKFLASEDAWFIIQ